MLKKPSIWFFIFYCLKVVTLSTGISAVLAQPGNSPLQSGLTGVISLNITTTPASCFNTNGTITINASGGTLPLMYSIDNGASYQGSNVFNGLDSALYMVMVKDADGYTASDVVRLTALLTPIVYIGRDTVLCSGSILFLAVPQLAGYSYVWDDGSTGYSYTVKQAGVYSVKVTNEDGCYASTSINVLFKSTNLFSLGNDTTVCNGAELQLKPTPSLQGSYLWNNGSVSPILTIHSPGVYWLKVTDSGCVKTDSIRISSKPNPPVSLGHDTALCPGQTLLLDATLSSSVYTWQDGSTNPTYNVNKTGTYSVRVAQNGCDTTVQVSVTYITMPVINFPKDTTVCIKQQMILDASYPYSSYLWQDGSALPQFEVKTAGTYTVQVTGLCGTTMDSSRVIFEDCDCTLHAPNAFTPNGDGRNDIFLPKFKCLISGYELKIFNRWGQQLFESRNASVGWDGSYGNQQQPTGTYIWEINYRDNLTGKRINKNGTLILIR